MSSRAGVKLPDVRLWAAVAGARTAATTSRALHIGGGTTIPGRVAERVDPRALEKLARRLGRGVVAVAGTNGKTTTARMLADILVADGLDVVHNRAGANLVSGVVTALTAHSSASVHGRDTVAVLEADEAALPSVIERASPSVVILTNLFRDQLDRFAEVDDLATSWNAALGTLPPSATVVVNADDPSLVAVTDGIRARRVCYGIAESIYRLPALPHAAEVLRCSVCAEPVSYRDIYVAHLGRWECRTCGRSRPSLDVAAVAVELWSQGFQSAKLLGLGEEIHVEAAVPGLYNTYNVVAAVTAARVLGVSSPVVRRAVADYRGAFGRAERFVHRGRTVTTMLVKNPVGCDEVLRALGEGDRRINGPLLFALNDNAADGRDVSWIWDVDFERMASWDVEMFCTGRRAADMRNRLHYAGVPSSRLRLLDGDVGPAFDEFVNAIAPGGDGYFLPTYTALLALRGVLTRRRELAAFWTE